MLAPIPLRISSGHVAALLQRSNSARLTLQTPNRDRTEEGGEEARKKRRGRAASESHQLLSPFFFTCPSLSPSIKGEALSSTPRLSQEESLHCSCWFLMGLIEGCCWLDGPEVVWGKSKKKVRRLFWWVRAELRKLVKMRKKRFCSFHYDPLSYSLNFDDGNFGFFCWFTVAVPFPQVRKKKPPQKKTRKNTESEWEVSENGRRWSERRDFGFCSFDVRDDNLCGIIMISSCSYCPLSSGETLRCTFEER